MLKPSVSGCVFLSLPLIFASTSNDRRGIWYGQNRKYYPPNIMHFPHTWSGEKIYSSRKTEGTKYRRFFLVGKNQARIIRRFRWGNSYSVCAAGLVNTHLWNECVCVCGACRGKNAEYTTHVCGSFPGHTNFLFLCQARRMNWKEKELFFVRLRISFRNRGAFLFQNCYYTYSRYFPAISSKDFLLLRFFYWTGDFVLIRFWEREKSLYGVMKHVLKPVHDSD